jgi:formylmethanofuran dehydrogenase subunit E
VIDEETMQQVIGFHGHMCPGLAMGMRAAEVALAQIGPHSSDEEVVAVVETDMCGVDAIQFLTGCTFGKGNLVHRDHGKNAYTFIRRRDGKAVRISPKPGSWGVRDPGWYDLFAAVRAGVASPDQRRRFGEIQQERSRDVLEAPLSELYDVREVDVAAPRPARILASVDCADCKEPTMETRIRRFEGAELCLPCFESRLAGNVPLASPGRRPAD